MKNQPQIFLVLLVCSFVFFSLTSSGASKKRKVIPASEQESYKAICALGQSETVNAGDSWKFIAKIKVKKKGAIKSCWGLLQGMDPTETLLPISTEICKVCDRDSENDLKNPECTKLLLHTDKNEIGIIGSYMFPKDTPSRVYKLSEIGVRPFNSPPTNGLEVRKCESEEPLTLSVKNPSGINLLSLTSHSSISLSGDTAKEVFFGESFFLKIQVASDSRISHGRLVFSISQGINEKSNKKFQGAYIIYPNQLPGDIVKGVKQTLLSKNSIELEITLQVPGLYVQAREFTFQALELQTESLQEIRVDLSKTPPVKIIQ